MKLPIAIYRLVELRNVHISLPGHNHSDELGIIACYYMARDCKITATTRASGQDFPEMPTAIMSDVNARLANWSTGSSTGKIENFH